MSAPRLEACELLFPAEMEEEFQSVCVVSDEAPLEVDDLFVGLARHILGHQVYSREETDDGGPVSRGTPSVFAKVPYEKMADVRSKTLSRFFRRRAMDLLGPPNR